MIDTAIPAMLPALKEMWRICFGDDKLYTDFIFSRLLRPENILVHTDNRGRPAAMLCTQPFQLVAGKEWARGAYIFGVCTLPEQQRCGLSTALLEKAHLRLAGKGFALSALVPANEGLFRFYGSRGYETAFAVKKAVGAVDELPSGTRPCVLKPASLGDLTSLRNKRFGDCIPYVRWDREYLEYIDAECTLLGGQVLAIDDDGYAVCYPMSKTLLIKELALPGHQVIDALAALAGHFGAERYECRLPSDLAVSLPNKVLPYAMTKWYDKENRVRQQKITGRAAYIAHVLD